MPWGFQRGGGPLQDYEKSRCSVVGSLPCPTDRSDKVFLVITLIVGEVLNLNSLRER